MASRGIDFGRDGPDDSLEEARVVLSGMYPPDWGVRGAGAGGRSLRGVEVGVGPVVDVNAEHLRYYDVKLTSTTAAVTQGKSGFPRRSSASTASTASTAHAGSVRTGAVIDRGHVGEMGKWKKGRREESARIVVKSCSRGGVEKVEEKRKVLGERSIYMRGR